VSAKVVVSKRKSRRMEQSEDDEPELSDKKSLVKVFKQAPEQDLSVSVRKEKEIKCSVKKKSKKSVAEPNGIKKRKLLLPNKSATVPNKKKKALHSGAH